MTTYLFDTFTDSNGVALSSHTPDIGTGWTVESFGNDAQIQADTATNSSFQSARPLAIDVPATADYQASATLVVNGGTSDKSFLMLRDTGTGTQGYYAGWDDSISAWAMYAMGSGADTLIGSNAAAPLTNPSSRALVFSAVGQLLELAVDGTVLLSITDATWASVGQGGMRIAGTFQSWQSFDDFTLSDVGGGGGGGTVHSGLHDSGSISVTAPGALTVECDNIPPDLGQSAITPPAFFHLGAVAFSDASGIFRNYFVEHPVELVVAPFPNATLVYYWFAPGVIATITELTTP